MAKFLIALSLLFSFLSVAHSEIPISEIEQKLKTEGLEVWVHGAVPNQSLYVVTYRRSDNFFVFADLSIYPASADARNILLSSKRHDRVRVWGRLVTPEGTTQPHIAADKITVLEKFRGLDPYPPYDRKTEIPKDLNGKTEFIGKVHALLHGGEILVVEFGDAVLPVFIEEKFRGLTTTLHRGDKIKIQFVIQRGPRKPTHLNLNPALEKPLSVLFSSVSEHERILTKSGSLVMFPQSPQIQFNVFALQQDIGDGVVLEYTLVNFESPEFFRQLREKLQAAWDAHSSTLKTGRNKLYNPKIRIEATGPINVIDPNQANPQVLIKSLDQIRITVE